MHQFTNMNVNSARLIVSLLLLVAPLSAFAQQPGQLSEQDEAKVTELFQKANAELEAKKYSSALANYQAALKIVPDEPALLYNGGFAALLNKDAAVAAALFTRLKKVEPDDWLGRAKLIQAHQILGNDAERDKERDELFALRRKGAIKELNEQIEYCRDRFEAGGKPVLAFELFEFKGPRGMRYVFSIMDGDRGEEEFRISLGSYDMTNSIWRDTTKPKPKDGLRLFHLDGYFPNGGHATYGMFPGEPTYEATKAMVVEILEKKRGPVSATVPAAKPNDR
jgi:tetratricopeptide (TPR) repeat protein